VAVVLRAAGAAEDVEHELASEGNGYFSTTVADAGAGILYRYRIDQSDGLYPDPASRFQPQGPHGPSQVVDPDQFEWTDLHWRGASLAGQIIYEMHVGTFTQQGTWEAALAHLPYLADLGITVIEVMPVAEFPGQFGWGYDGVDLFAPTHLYGNPDDFRRFVDRAHSLNLAVLLDVVYNHIGPDGNYLKVFSESYFTDRYKNEWGEAINFDGVESTPVREFVISNARYWTDEFHLDGLRLDATQQIFDSSARHILREICCAARQGARGRSTIIVAENEKQEAKAVRSIDCGGYGLDGMWNDDLHHSAMVALTGRREAYYTDYAGTPQELISSVKWGFLYQGQRYKWQKQRRGTPSLDLRPEQFITFLQNHDQVANSARGTRSHAISSPARHRALTAFLLLAPGTPMLFQGEEFAASTPFLFFADHRAELAARVRVGRAKFLTQFPSCALAETQKILADPADPKTFLDCKLDHTERDRNRNAIELHRDLLWLRRTDSLLRAPRRHGYDGAVLSSQAFVIRFFGSCGDDRILVVNFGNDLHLDPAPEPLLAPPEQKRWGTLWSSEDLKYGGIGTPTLDSDENWRIPGDATVLLCAQSME
jgi:maltooligosyltrehalose trehalohydrolase